MPAGLRRQLEGGHADDYEERRARRGATGRAQAPSWSAEAAMAMLATLDACAEADGEDSRGKQMLRVLTSIAARARLDAALPEDMSS